MELLVETGDVVGGRRPEGVEFLSWAAMGAICGLGRMKMVRDVSESVRGCGTRKVPVRQEDTYGRGKPRRVRQLLLWGYQGR